MNTAGARPEIWSYGIRNPQGMAMNPWSDTLWLNEHGPRGGMRSTSGEREKLWLAAGDPRYQLQRIKIPEAKGEHVEGTENRCLSGKSHPP